MIWELQYSYECPASVVQNLQVGNILKTLVFVLSLLFCENDPQGISITWFRFKGIVFRSLLSEKSLLTYLDHPPNFRREPCGLKSAGLERQSQPNPAPLKKGTLLEQKIVSVRIETLQYTFPRQIISKVASKTAFQLLLWTGNLECECKPPFPLQTPDSFNNLSPGPDSPHNSLSGERMRNHWIKYWSLSPSTSLLKRS